MSKKKLLLFGGSGLVGTRIQEMLSKTYYLISPTRTEVDLTQDYRVKNIIEETNPDIIIYSAGISSQDIAEKQKELALQLNKVTPNWIAKKAAQKNIPLIYFSTDAVFKGNQSDHPYLETESIDPINFYGFTKAKGEEVILAASNKNLVIRLISVYTSIYPRRLDFARFLTKNLLENKPTLGITDQYFNPTYSDDITHFLKQALEKNVSGIYHLGATDYTSNFSFAKLLVKKIGANDKLILPITLEQFTKDKNAKRAKYAWLDVTKTINMFNTSVLHTNAANLTRFSQNFSKTN